VALGAGALLPLAFAPFGLWPLALLAPAALFACWLPAASGRAAWRGWLFGLGLFGVGVSWIRESFQYAAIGAWLSVPMTAGFVALLALYPAALGAGLGLLRGRSSAARLLLVYPAAWTLAEWLRGWLLGGFPWLGLGVSQLDSPLAALLPLGGVLAASFAVALTGGALVLALAPGSSPAGRGLAVLVLALPWVVAALAGRAVWVRPAGEALRVALVQGNVPQGEKWLARMRLPTARRYLELTRRELGADLIVWPESALPGYLVTFEPLIEAIAGEVAAAGGDLLLGIPTLERGGRRPRNSVVLRGGSRGRYDKRHLVPFGEYLPLPGLLGPITAALGIRVADFAPGPPDPPLLVSRGRPLGVFVCYEIAFGDEVRQALPEAEILVTVSNDAWFGRSIGPAQHLQLARARALETGRWLLRATNTGITAIIGPDGALRARAPQFETTVLAGEVRPLRGATPYVRLGDRALAALLAALLATGVWLAARAARERR